MKSTIPSGRWTIRYARSFHVAGSPIRDSSRANQPPSAGRYGGGSSMPSSRDARNRSKRAISRQIQIMITTGSPNVRIATPNPVESPVAITTKYAIPSGSAIVKYTIRFHERASSAHETSARTADAGVVTGVTTVMPAKLSRCRLRATLDHELETAVSPPVSAPTAISAGSAPLTPLLGALSPARVIALQRTVGNRAVSALLQRDDAQKTHAGGPGDFGVSGGVPSGSGTATASPGGGNTVTAKSAKVTLDGEAWLLDGKQLGTSAYFGVIQNLVSSNRGAQYRHGGDPNGEIVAEPHSGEASKWDAAIDPQKDAKGNDKPQTFAPFYWQPGNIDDSNDKSNHAKPTRLGTPWDQPEFSMPVQNGAGRLTAFKGQDVFKMGLAVKKDAPSGCSPATSGRSRGTFRSTRASTVRAKRSRRSRSRTCSRTGRTRR